MRKVLSRLKRKGREKPDPGEQGTANIPPQSRAEQLLEQSGSAPDKITISRSLDPLLEPSKPDAGNPVLPPDHVSASGPAIFSPTTIPPLGEGDKKGKEGFSNKRAKNSPEIAKPNSDKENLEAPEEAGKDAIPGIATQGGVGKNQMGSQAEKHLVNDAIRTQWSENISDLDEKIVSVDELDDLTGLVLPKSAKFEIDEVSLRERTGIKVGGKVILALPDIPQTDTANLEPAVSEVVTTGKKMKKAKSPITKKTGFFKVWKPEIKTYNPQTDGPLVNIVMRPAPGLEEIELYPVNDPYASVRISFDHNTHEYTYEVLEPILSPVEMDLLSELKSRIFESLQMNTRDLDLVSAKETLFSAIDEIIADYKIPLTPSQREKILYHMHRDFLGHGLIDAIMHDPYIEDISCDGVNSYLFVYHTRYESMKTNVKFTKADELDSFVTKLAQRAGKYISIAEPMLDATMIDGSRIQMTLGHEVTAHGSTFTIRKFREEPITATDLIEWSTFSPLSVAFLWLAIESGKSAIMVGGTASGKTTTMNAISLFIPPLAKIVTLEDTRELKLPHPNWIPSVTRASFDTEGKGEIDMYELLKAAMRQRPEYIIVGEVRGREALTLFQAMSTGHVTYSTMHADSVASAVHRLENAPLNVPRNMLSALDLVVVQVQARISGQRIRRCKQIIEVLDLDPRTNELITNEAFRWRQSTDEITYSGKSFVLEEIMEARGWNEDRLREELKRRQEVLEWMRVNNIRQYRDVSQMLISYFRDPEAMIQKVRTELYE